MANNPKGLGKGLAALLGDDVIDSQEEKSSLFLPISQVESCASQPRKQFDPESLADLADSIREHGIIQPLTVRKCSPAITRSSPVSGAGGPPAWRD